MKDNGPVTYHKNVYAVAVPLLGFHDKKLDVSPLSEIGCYYGLIPLFLLPPWPYYFLNNWNRNISDLQYRESKSKTILY